MKPSSIYAGLSAFITTALAASRTSPPAGCIAVPRDFSTIQAAVNSLSTTSTASQCIFISPGTYREQVLVPKRTAQLSVYGSTTDDTSYASNTVRIVQSKGASQGYSNDETATLRVKCDGFRLYNVDVENSYGEGTQAVALSAYSNSGFYGTRLIGYQDTLLANQGSQIYVKSEISGATDFIFGQRAIAWFERVDVRCVARSVGYVTGKPLPTSHPDRKKSQYIY
jgi:pectinesterase